jgi:hypothetical protein
MGAVAVTGSPAPHRAGHQLPAAAGAVLVTGQSVTLMAEYRLTHRVHAPQAYPGDANRT